MLLLSLACAAPEAPDDLNELSRYLFREFENEDPAVMLAGAEEMALLMAQQDMGAGPVDRAYELEPLEEDDAHDIVKPDRDIGATLQVGLFGAADHPVEAHAEYIVWEDQTPINGTIDYYNRYFDLEPTQPQCLPDESCEGVRSRSEAQRSFGYSAYYEGRKDFRWITLADGRRGVFARGWNEQEWPTDDGEGAIHQSYDVDVWLEDPSGEGIWRYYAGWTESSVSDLDDDTVLLTVRAATETRFGKEEDAAGEIVGE